MEPDQQARLAEWLGGVLAAPTRIVGMRKLSGGAIQENWLVETESGGQAYGFVLRKDAAATISASHGRADEFALIRAAHAASVTVPEPVAFCADAAVIGGPFALVRQVAGIGFGPKIVKEMSLGGDREALAARLGHELALIHAIRPPCTDLAFLGAPPVDPAMADIVWLRGALDTLGAARPALDWSLRWAERHRPQPQAITLIHRDFRTGNYMVDGQGLTAILDWEFAAWGDPMSDLGWFCAECWRFGRDDLEAGGIGSRAAFERGYAAGGGVAIDRQAVAFWEVMAHVRWAVIALQQGARHASGREFSLEHALTGRIAAELELTALKMTAPAHWRAA